MLCVAIHAYSFADLQEQIALAKPYAQLIELPLHLLPFATLPVLEEIIATASIPILITYKPAVFSQEEIAYTYRLAELSPAYLDLDFQAPISLIKELQVRYRQVKCIVSHHDFEKTPSSEALISLFETMQKKPAHLYKIAVQAHSSLDALRLLAFVKETRGNLIAVSMGYFGQISRILGPIFGVPITFASNSPDRQTAPGQIPAAILCDRYNHKNIHPQTKIYGLIGDPVDQSISDQTHNHLLQELHIDAVYVKIPLKKEELFSFIQLAKQLPFYGLSVTMPLKEAILPYIEQPDVSVLQIGAANTLAFIDNTLAAINTDGEGAIRALGSVSGKSLLLMGTGGAAKAIAFQGALKGAHVSFLSRNPEKKLPFPVYPYDAIFPCDILINCTPEPMPLLPEQISTCCAMDIKTKPLLTTFLSHAQDSGCTIVHGYRMFIEQALLQFLFWFPETICQTQALGLLQEKAEEVLSEQS